MAAKLSIFSKDDRNVLPRGDAASFDVKNGPMTSFGILHETTDTIPTYKPKCMINLSPSSLMHIGGSLGFRLPGRTKPRFATAPVLRMRRA